VIEQGTPEWHQLRCGKVTASRVADIVRKVKSGGVSASRQRYLGELVAERLTGCPTVGFKSADMEWGNANEDNARQFYAFMNDVTLETIAFVPHPTIEMAGASPDRLVGADGLVEIKAPAIHTHIETLLTGEIEPDYQKQMCWQMACTGRQWVDLVSYEPRLPENLRMFTKRVHRDETAIKAMEAEVEKFLAEVEDTIRQLQRLER
jgi:putative phage-type endonuclease